MSVVLRASREVDSEESRPGSYIECYTVSDIDAGPESNSTVNCMESYSEAERTVIS